MNEVVSCVIEYAFESLGLTTVEVYTCREKANSSRLLEKNKIRVDREKYDENNVNNVICRLTKYELDVSRH